MKKFLIYLSDCPDDALGCPAKNRTEAIRKAHKYIRDWGLDATICRIVEIETNGTEVEVVA